MAVQTQAPAARALEGVTRPLQDTPQDFDALLDRIGDARFVLLGEASHGTHEFYRARARISRRLIEERGFAAIAVEADWPDAYRVNRFIRGRPGDPDPVAALGGFKRFPQWMWRNTDIVALVQILRDYNAAQASEAAKCGYYGLDLYSLHASIEAVIEYLRKIDPEAAKRARERYSCFDHFGAEPQNYGYSAALGLSETCEAEVIAQLREMLAAVPTYASKDGSVSPEDAFFAAWNARVVASAEQYYRSMFGSREASWNLRDRHMADTLNALDQYLTSQRAAPARIVVWAHNSHLGDARATEMAERGELNVGQLMRERYGDAVHSVGFTTYSGTVTAASDWDAPAERKRVRPALTGSYESLFHEVGGNFEIDLWGSKAVAALERPHLERAIGVIYRPSTERVSHYFDARLPEQFDTVFHYDVTRAVEPLERTPVWTEGEAEPPETFPFGV